MGSGQISLNVDAIASDQNGKFDLTPFRQVQGTLT
jgi:hypothetical protein